MGGPGGTGGQGGSAGVSDDVLQVLSGIVQLGLSAYLETSGLTTALGYESGVQNVPLTG